MTDSEKPTKAAGNAVAVPRVSVSSFNVMASDRIFGILCQDLAPARMDDGSLGAADVPQVYLSMPITSAKELSLLLKEFVAQHESMFGEITSDFIKARESA